MLGKTHTTIGFFIALLFLFFFEGNPWIFIVMGILGSLLPDIDRSTSYIGRGAGMIPDFFSHRGFFHSFYALILFSLLVFYVFGMVYAVLFATSFFFHLIFDALTKKGISFFMVSGRVKGPFLSGGMFDRMLFLIFSVLNLCFLIFMF